MTVTERRACNEWKTESDPVVKISRREYNDTDSLFDCCSPGRFCSEFRDDCCCISAAAAFCIALETLGWRALAWILGWDFIGYILNDPWAINRKGKQKRAHQIRKGD